MNPGPRTLRPMLALGAVLALLGLLILGRVMFGDPLVRTGDLRLILGGANLPGLTYIVEQVRAPAAVVGALAGCAFGISGTLFQTLLRNPLASPDVIGVSYGATAAVVIAMLVFGVQGLGLSLVAVLGGAVSAGVVLWVARGSGARFVLVGIGVAAALQAVISFLLTRSSVRSAQQALQWMVGSLNAATWERAGILAAPLAVLVVPTVLLISRLEILELGDDMATALGVRTAVVRSALVALGVALSAVAVAVTGPIAFVAFLAGPLARMVLGPVLRGRLPLGVLLPAAALVGACLVVAADLAGSVLFGDTDLPAGIITGLIGAPFLLWLLARSPRLRGE